MLSVHDVIDGRARPFSIWDKNGCDNSTSAANSTSVNSCATRRSRMAKPNDFHSMV